MIEIDKSAVLQPPDDVEGCAVYVVTGEVQVPGVAIPQHSLAVLNVATRVELTAANENLQVVVGPGFGYYQLRG